MSWIIGLVAFSLALYCYIVVAEWWPNRPYWMKQLQGIAVARIERNLQLSCVDDEYQAAKEAIDEIEDNGQGVSEHPSVQHEGRRSTT